MPCINLSSNRGLSCIGSNSGGVKAIGFVEYQEGLISATAGEVTTLAPITRIFRYRVQNSGNTWTENIVTDQENRTRSFDAELAVVLQRLDLETRNEIDEMTKGDLIVFVETNAGDIIVMGLENGALITGGSSTTGGSKTDFAGYNLTISASETQMFSRLAPAAKAEYATLTQE